MRWLKVKLNARSIVAFTAVSCCAFLFNLQQSIPSPLSEAELKHRIANYFGYSISELSFGVGDFSPPFRQRTFYPTEASTYSLWEAQVQTFTVKLPDGSYWKIDIDRYSGVMESVENMVLNDEIWNFMEMEAHIDPETGVEDPTINLPFSKDEMIAPEKAIRLTRNYLQRYYPWTDTSNWRLLNIGPKTIGPLDNPIGWEKACSLIIATFAPDLPKPDGLEIHNQIQYAQVVIHPLTGAFVSYYGYYAPINIPLEPIVTHPEAVNIAVQKVQELTGKPARMHPDCRPNLLLAQDPLNGPVRLAWIVEIQYEDPSYIWGTPGYTVFVDSLTSEVISAYE